MLMHYFLVYFNAEIMIANPKVQDYYNFVRNSTWTNIIWLMLPSDNIHTTVLILHNMYYVLRFTRSIQHIMQGVYR